MSSDMEFEEEGERAWAGRAEAVLSLTPGSSIPICYHSQFGLHDDLILLEVDEKLLPHILQNRASIRGQPDEDAILCTYSSTYALKFVGTSNSMFLIPSGDPATRTTTSLSCNSETSCPASVITVALGSIELNEAAPKLDKLKKLLRERPYNLEEGYELNPRHMEGLCRWRDLVETIQASEEELRDALKSLSAVDIDGYWRIIDDKTMNETLDMILRNSVLHGWQLSALNEEHVLLVLEADGFPPRIVSHCLEALGSKIHASNGALWGLEEKKVCLRLALRVLSGGKMKLESFMEKWEQSVPSGMRPDLKMLRGEVLYDKIGVEDWIRVFKVSDLPSAPADRFAALFQERPKWEWKDLEPFILDLQVPGLSSEALLIKYTRRTQPHADAEPIFSSR